MPRSWYDKLPYFPIVNVLSGGLVPHVNRDDRGRIIRAYGRITGEMNVQGTTVSRRVRDHLASSRSVGDHCGHIIPKACGGSGEDLDNVFPQNPSINQADGAFDGQRAEWLSDKNRIIVFEFFFQYEGDNLRPSHYLVAYDFWYIDEDGHLCLQSTMRDGEENYCSDLTRKFWRDDDESKNGGGSAASRSVRQTTKNSSNSSSKADSDSLLAKGVVFGAKSANSAIKAGTIAASAGKSVPMAAKLLPTKTVLVPVAAAVDVYRLGSAIASGDGGKVVTTTARIGGEWGGGYGGASFGAMLGTSIFPGVGTIIGGIVGGIAGALTGGAVAGGIAEKIVE